MDGAHACRYCESSWVKMVDIARCEQCQADREFFDVEVSGICSNLISADICQGRSATDTVENTTCNHLGRGADCRRLGTPPLHRAPGAREIASGLDEAGEADEGQTRALLRV